MSGTLLAYPPPHIANINIRGRASAQTVARRLVLASVEFHVEPLPFDHWVLTVKAEHEGVLADCSRCWQFFGPDTSKQQVSYDTNDPRRLKQHALWCDLRVDHDGRHNGNQSATYERVRDL